MMPIQLQFKFQKKISNKTSTAEGTLQFNSTSLIQVLMGASGAGKSTLARWIVGLIPADDGFLKFGEQIWCDQARGINVRSQQRRIGFMAQGDFLFPHLNVAGNVGYGLRTWEATKRKSRVEQMFNLTGISSLADRKPSTLSGGEKRRVALAQVLAIEPQLMILDEPFAGLDLAAKKLLWEQTGAWISNVAVPTILITHDPVEAEVFSEHIHFYDRENTLRIPPR